MRYRAPAARQGGEVVEHGITPSGSERAMPTAEEREEMRQIDARLDAFAKLIKDKARCPDTPLQ